MLTLADRSVYSYTRRTCEAATDADLLWRVPSHLVLHPVEVLADGSYLTEITTPGKFASSSTSCPLSRTAKTNCID
jgi:hypothetical protein